ncbi:MAG: GyrI-like domain-containing protein [Brevundimonas sp.]|uniref:AraC family transcriptional regulator n=1 Tax=Brevundimonas sp. TaxID=1871086 RepID=UPI003919E765
MSGDVVDNYHARMRRALVFVDAHLDGDLSLTAVSDAAAFSHHHFQRQFSALFGISLGRYVQLKRLKRAAYRLAFRNGHSVLEIALDSGFEGPEAFSRAFRRHFDQSPSDFRKTPRWKPWRAAQTPLTQARSQTMTQTFTPADVRIVDFPATPVAVLRHDGGGDQIGDAVRRFIAWRKAAGLPPRLSATFNIFHPDSEVEGSAPVRIDLCAATTRPVAPNEAGVFADVIPAGRCAVLRQIGDSDDLSVAANWLYGQWLPQSGQDTRDFPLFAQRVVFFPDAPEHEAVTDLFLPLRA